MVKRYKFLREGLEQCLGQRKKLVPREIFRGTEKCYQSAHEMGEGALSSRGESLESDIHLYGKGFGHTRESRASVHLSAFSGNTLEGPGNLLGINHTSLHPAV